MILHYFKTDLLFGKYIIVSDESVNNVPDRVSFTKCI